MSININSLRVGILNQLDVDSITVLLQGGINHFHAPQGTEYPFICYWIVTGSNEDSFTEWKDEVICQIDIFSNSSSLLESGNIAEKVAEQMDNAEIISSLDPITEEPIYSVYFCQRQGPPRPLYEEDTGVWHSILEYRIKIEKSKS